MTEPVETRILSDAGKMLPSAIDVEEVVLGALILQRDSYSLIHKILNPESFYKDEHMEIFEAIVQLHTKGKPIDLLTVVNQLRATGKLETAGGAFYISELATRVSSAANIEYHSRILAQKYLLRKIISITANAQRSAYDDMSDSFKIMSDLKDQLLELEGSFVDIEAVHISEIANKTIYELQERMNKPKGSQGVKTHLRPLDEVLGTLEGGDYIIIAGRTSMGKSIAALSIIYNIATIEKKPVALFTLEVSSKRFCINLFAHASEINSNQIKNMDIMPYEKDQYLSGITKVSEMPLWIDDDFDLTIESFRVKLKKLKEKHGIELAVIDYVQLMKADKKLIREQQIASISRGIKAAAKEFNIPVIALAQIGRGAETRGGAKIPILSDLRESSALENDADMVILLYRPEYYGIETDENGESFKDVALFIVAKNRNGSTDTVKLKSQLQFLKFTTWEDNSGFRRIARDITQSQSERNAENESDMPF